MRPIRPPSSATWARTPGSASTLIPKRECGRADIQAPLDIQAERDGGEIVGTELPVRWAVSRAGGRNASAGPAARTGRPSSFPVAKHPG